MKVEIWVAMQDTNVKKIVWINIVYHLRILMTLVMDNEMQFNSKLFLDFCVELKIQNCILL